MSIDNIRITVYYTLRPTLEISSESTGRLGSPYSPVPYNDWQCKGWDYALPIGNTGPQTDFLGSWTPDVHHGFDEVMTGFTDDDITVDDADVITFHNEYNPSFYHYVDNIDVSPYTSTGSFTVSVAADRATNASMIGNAAASRTFTITTSELMCACGGYDIDSVYWPMNSTSTIYDAILPAQISPVINDTDHEPSSVHGIQNGTVVGASSLLSGDIPGGTSAWNDDGSAAFDGTDDYVRYNRTPITYVGQQKRGDPPFDDFAHVVLYAKSDDDTLANQTLFQLNTVTTPNLLTIAYESGKTNKLHVSTRYGGNVVSKVSSQEFDIETWHRIEVYFSSGLIRVVLDGTEVTANDGSPPSAPVGTAVDRITLGAAYNDGSYEHFYDGNLDEFLLGYSWSWGTACSPLTTFLIQALPSANHSVRHANIPSIDPSESGQLGTIPVRIKKDNVTIADTDTSFPTNRDWSSVTADTNVTDLTSIPSDPKSVISYSGMSTGVTGTHTIYVPKGTTTSFKVCPDATTLAAVTTSCANGVLFQGAFPQTEDVGVDTVTVDTTIIDGVTYWSASGLTGSGGIGVGSVINAVPEFGAVPFILLIVGCGWYLKRKVLA